MHIKMTSWEPGLVAFIKVLWRCSATLTIALASSVNQAHSEAHKILASFMDLLRIFYASGDRMSTFLLKGFCEAGFFRNWKLITGLNWLWELLLGKFWFSCCPVIFWPQAFSFLIFVQVFPSIFSRKTGGACFRWFLQNVPKHSLMAL